MIDNEGRARPYLDMKISSRARSVSRDSVPKWGVPWVHILREVVCAIVSGD